ncbi:hypothetical protein QTO30_10230 [Yoonia sp. GPGPB17]|uniref:hypothetical protein n=1 Tax=Yoonia sp. GPGPB17 TaxID=3026147 RepID=UPI0030BFA5BA
MIEIGPFRFISDEISTSKLVEICLKNISAPSAAALGLSEKSSLRTDELVQRFENLTISGETKIQFSDSLRESTLTLIVDNDLTFERGAVLETNINLRIRAQRVIGELLVKSFGAKAGDHGRDREGRAADGPHGENDGANGLHGSDKTGSDGGDADDGKDGLPGQNGKSGGNATNGESGRSISIFAGSFTFGSSAVVESSGADGGNGGNGQHGGNGGNGRNGGRGGDGGKGNLFHRAGNAGRGGDGGDAGRGGHGGSTGRNGNGGDGGDVSILVESSAGLPWIGDAISEPGIGGNNPFGYGRRGNHGKAGKGGGPGYPGSNTVPGRRQGKTNDPGEDGFVPKTPAENGAVRRPGRNGLQGKEDGPRVATQFDVVEFFAEVVEGTVDV